MTMYKLDKILLPSSVSIDQLDDVEWSPGTEYMIENAAGQHHAQFVAVREQRPAVNFTSTQLEALLGVLGANGASLGSTATYLKKMATIAPTARATAEHILLTIASSVGYWSTITLPHNGRATLRGTLQAAYNGTNEPIVYAGSTALNGNLAADEYFGAGPLSVNGTDISGIQEITLTSGVQLIITGGSSSEWPTFVGVGSVQHTIDVKLNHEINWSTLGLDGTALDGADGVTFYARRYAADGARVANGTANHIKFVGANGIVCPVNTGGQGADLVTDSFRATLIAPDDSTSPLIITTSSAIT